MGKTIRGPIKTQQNHNRKKTNESENESERRTNQSQANGTFENKNHVNDVEKITITTSDNSILKCSKLFTDKQMRIWIEKTAIIGGLLEKYWTLLEGETTVPKQGDWWKNRTRCHAWEHTPAITRRQYDHQTQRTIFAPTRPNKRRRDCRV